MARAAVIALAPLVFAAENQRQPRPTRRAPRPGAGEGLAARAMNFGTRRSNKCSLFAGVELTPPLTNGDVHSLENLI